MFMYCKKCGLIKNFKTKESFCPACEIKLDAVPSEYLTSSGLMFVSQEAKKQFEDRIKSAPEFDEVASKLSAGIIAEKEEMHNKEINEKAEIYKSTIPQKTCPVCHSTSLSKISNIGKGMKIAAFGILGAGDIGKTWKCNSCGLKF